MRSSRRIARTIGAILLAIFIVVGVLIVNTRKSTNPRTGATPTKGEVRLHPEKGRGPLGTLRPAMYWEKLPGKKVRCNLCFRKCIVGEGEIGFCRNRINKGGEYYTLVYGLPCAVQIDPIEKEPQHHMLAGSEILCIGTASCNFRCKFCHNWHMSQRDIHQTLNYDLPPEKIVELAIENKYPTISFTYNEPTVFYEYVLDIAKLAQKRGIKILFHSNGSMSPEPLRELLKYTNAVTIDLKGFTNKFYSEASSARLEPVLETLKIIKEEGKWLEIVNLIIPTLNDDPKDIKRMCEWIKKNLGDEVPIHFNRFSPTYKMQNLPPTPIKTLEEAKNIAKEVGIKYVYIGNVPGHEGNSTYCPKCKKRLVRRIHFTILENKIKEGRCSYCGENIPGLW